MNRSKIYQFFQGSMVLIISNIILKSISFFLLPMYTAYLIPEQLGTADSITNMTSLLFTVLVMGMDSAFGAFFYSEQGAAYQKKVFNTTLFHMLLVNLCVIPLFFFSDSIAVTVFFSVEYSDAIRVSLLAVVLNLWYLPFSLMLRLENKMTKFSVINVLASLSMILLNVYFVTVKQLGVMALILSTSIVNLLQLGLYYMASQRTVSVKNIDFSLYKSMLKYALPMLPMIMAAWVLNLSDRYILLYYCGEYAVGIYGIAARFLMVLNVITSGIYTAYTSFAFSSVHDENAKEQYVKVLDAVFCVLFAICVMVSLFGKEVITVMANENYLSSYTILAPLLFGQLCYAVNTIVGYGIAHAKHSAFFLIPTGVGMIVNLVLNVIFIPEFGVQAAANTTLVGYFVMMLITYWIAERYYHCPYHFGKIVVTMAVTYTVLAVMLQKTFFMKLICLITVALVTGFLFRDIVVDIVWNIKLVLHRKKI